MPTSFRARWLIVTILGAILIVAASIFGGKQLGASQQSTLDKAKANSALAAVTALRLSSDASCFRGNQQRVAINKSTAGTYKAFYLNGTLELAASKVGKDPKRKQIERTSAQAIISAADTLQYLPLTDCTEAHAHPSTYVLAAPTPYVQYLAQQKHKHP